MSGEKSIGVMGSGAAAADSTTAPAAPATPAAASDAPPMLEVADLHAGYHRKEIIHGIDFAVQPGEFVCIIGANGSGKTTTLKSLLGLIKPFSGSVKINGQSISGLSEKKLARHFAYIPQAHTPPFPFSVADVVLLGRTPYLNRLAYINPEDRAIAYNAICQVGIEDLAKRTYTHLSGGQQQLVLIARALAQESEVLVMDEPTASLDFGNQHAVLTQAKSLVNAGRSVIMVTHDPGHAFFCATRVIIMHEGRIYADGDPKSVITKDSLRTIYNIDIEVITIPVSDRDHRQVCIPIN